MLIQRHITPCYAAIDFHFRYMLLATLLFAAATLRLFYLLLPFFTLMIRLLLLPLMLPC